MSSKTKIVVLHMKELIYTGIFAALGILFIVLLIFMFKPDKKEQSAQTPNESNQADTLPSENMTDPSTANQSDANAAISSTDESASPVLSDTAYIPGIYTTELVLNEQIVDVEVIVNRDYISSIRLVNLSEAVTTMYPLLQPTFDSLCEQIYETQSLENISYQSDSKYTSLVLLQAIRNSLEKAYIAE